MIFSLLSGCSQAVQATANPGDSLPTVVALTGQAIFATSNALTSIAVPSKTPFPSETPIPPTQPPSATPTFAAGFTELAQIHVLAPGPMSSLVSPFNLQAMLISGKSEIVQVDLLGEDGRVLQRNIEHVANTYNGNYREFRLSFEIRAVSEAGYIRISSKDEFGRIQVLNTMPVLLYSIGSTQIKPVGNMIYERIMLDGIQNRQVIFGGVLNLKGRFWPFNDQPVIFDLLLPDGKSISSRVLKFNGVNTQDFETTIPYKVSEPTMVRLSVRQDNPLISFSDPDLKKYIYVYTTELLLNP